MLRSHAGPVVGLHPLFGPATKSMDRQIVVVNAGRDPQHCQWLLDPLAVWGNVLVHTSPEEHDDVMGIVQSFLQNLDLIQRGGRSEFVTRFREIAAWFGPFSEQALRESTFLVEKLVHRL